MPGRPRAALCLCFLGIPSISSLSSGIDGMPDPSSIEEEKRGENKVVQQDRTGFWALGSATHVLHGLGQSFDFY